MNSIPSDSSHFNPGRLGSLPDTARGEAHPPATQSPPSRSITLPLEHVKVLLSLIDSVCLADAEKEIIKKTAKRVAKESRLPIPTVMRAAQHESYWSGRDFGDESDT